MTNQIELGDIVKANGKVYGQVFGIDGTKYQVMTTVGNLIVTKTVEFFKKPARQFVKN